MFHVLLVVKDVHCFTRFHTFTLFYECFTMFYEHMISLGFMSVLQCSMSVS